MSGWEMSEQSDKIVPALVRVLGQLGDVKKSETASMGDYSYSYADLGAVLGDVKPLLQGEGLAVSQPVSADGVTTIVFHTSGQWVQFGPLQIRPTANTPQGHGSAITYARRYQLLAALCMATEDDDGAKGSEEPREHPLSKRVTVVQNDMRGLSDDKKAELKTWADGHSLAVPAMLNNETWLGRVESWLDEHSQGGT